MRLIRYLGRRAALVGPDRQVDIGLFHCSACGNDIELSVKYGRHKGHCGCQIRSYKLIKISRPKPAERRCLMCGKRFISRGPHNRRCAVCEHKMEMDGQAYYMPPVHKNSDHSTVACCAED